MTISSLAKMLVGVNNVVVENLDFSADDNEIIISARPYKRDQCRCGICGRKGMVLLYSNFPGQGTNQDSLKTLKKRLCGCRCICPGKASRNI